MHGFCLPSAILVVLWRLWCANDHACFAAGASVTAAGSGDPGHVKPAGQSKEESIDMLQWCSISTRCCAKLVLWFV